MGHVHCAVMYSDALSDDVTVQTKKEIWLLKESNCVWQRNQLKNHSKKELILAPPRIDSSMNQKFLLLIPECTLSVFMHQSCTEKERCLELWIAL